MAINTGVNISKLVAYAFLAPNPGVNVTKLNAYAFLGVNPGVNVTKLNAYAFLAFNNANPPVWPSFTFGGGVIGAAYSQQFDLTPAAPTTTYTVVSGSLPTGLSLNSISADLGSITGTPTVAGTYSFTLRATNSFGTADQVFSIIISSASTGGYSFTFAA